MVQDAPPGQSGLQQALRTHLFTVRERDEQLSRGSRIYCRVDIGKPLGAATLRRSDLRDAAKEPSFGS
jgi:hypothetical protein